MCACAYEKFLFVIARTSTHRQPIGNPSATQENREKNPRKSRNLKKIKKIEKEMKKKKMKNTFSDAID